MDSRELAQRFDELKVLIIEILKMLSDDNYESELLKEDKNEVSEGS